MRRGVPGLFFAALALASGCVRAGAASEATEPRAARTATTPAARASLRGTPDTVSSRLGAPAAYRPTSPRDCYAALWHAGVTFDVVPREVAPGVQSPLRLRSGIGGVAVAPREPSTVHEIIDCRLAMSLLAWAPKLRNAGVYRIDHYSIYRPGARTPHHHVSGHAHALAIDAARFHLVSGAVVDVLSDWEDRDRGGQPCPERPEEAWPSRLLRGVVCDAIHEGLFQVVLTPHHDAAHANHVHLEVRPHVDWTYVR